jgi:hypothetical protein
MAKFVVPDPERVTSVEAQAVGDYGVFPVAVAASSRTEAEWEQLINENDLPLVIKDVRKVTDEIRGTALHAAVEASDDEGATPDQNSEQQPEPPVSTGSTGEEE